MKNAPRQTFRYDSDSIGIKKGSRLDQADSLYLMILMYRNYTSGTYDITVTDTFSLCHKFFLSIRVGRNKPGAIPSYCTYVSFNSFTVLTTFYKVAILSLRSVNAVIQLHAPSSLSNDSEYIAIENTIHCQ